MGPSSRVYTADLVGLVGFLRRMSEGTCWVDTGPAGGLWFDEGAGVSKASFCGWWLI